MSDIPPLHFIYGLKLKLIKKCHFTNRLEHKLRRMRKLSHNNNNINVVMCYLPTISDILIYVPVSNSTGSM